MSIEEQRYAADRLEELTIASKEIVRLLRQGQSDRKAHALLYVLRREMTYVVRTIPIFGVPNAEHTAYADEVIRSAIWEDRSEDQET